MEITLRATGREDLSHPVRPASLEPLTSRPASPLIFLEVLSFIRSSQLPYVFGLPLSSIAALSVVCFLGDSVLAASKKCLEFSSFFLRMPQ
ncbi:hypothetical protein LR48_Vigan553s002400 [Vigna angularis]|uniref:Uncharacterized protein n=1 Tax=Phaseolus angularis TaxID=3914 RepID=A0A0L9TDB4_PHAAN|nr:hypothetical protein LR48_Vigan553s002400 [Vigna angularis]